MDKLRLIKDTDYPVLAAFWAFAGEPCNTQDIYPKHSTYVFERNNHILYAVGLYKVEGIPIAFAEGFIRNPNKQSDMGAVKALQAHIESQAKYMGCKHLIAVSKNEKLTKHHIELGYNKVSAGSFMAKHLGDQSCQ